MKRLITFPNETLAAILLPLILLHAAPRAAAQSKDTYWTSVEGVTIWARLTGINGSTVLLVRSGREYQVPLGRLTPESVAKARRLLDMPASASKGEVLPPASNPANDDTASMELDLPEIPENEAASNDSPPGVLPEKGEIPPPSTAATPARGKTTGIRPQSRQAIAPAGAPSPVRAAISAGNNLQTKAYKWGGGRARLEDNGYDCSGSVSYVLIKAGLLRSPVTSGAFTRYGQPGPGRWITIYARNGHVFMTLCGLRLDTGGHGGRGESGPRWCSNLRGTGGFVMRHPPGF